MQIKELSKVNLSVPSGWKIETLVATANSAMGFIDGDWIEAPYITNEGIRLVQTGNIGLGQFINRPEFRKFISKQSFQELGCKWVYPGDILICRLAEPIGRACVVPTEIGLCVTAVDCTIYRPLLEKIDSAFAVHLFNSALHLRKVDDLAGGSTRQRISRKNLGNLTLLLPSLPEQRYIAEILDTLDEVIARTESLIAKLKQMKAGLLHDLLTRGLNENGQVRDAIAHPEQFKDLLIGQIPKQWKVLNLSEVGTWLSGGTPNKGVSAYWDGKIPWVSPKDMKHLYLEDTIDHITDTGANAGTRIVPSGTVFIVVRGMIIAHFLPISIARREMAFNQDIKAVICNATVSFLYLAYWSMANSSNLLRLVTEATHGTKRFDLKDLLSYQIAIPSRTEQDRIIKILDTHNTRIRREEAYRDKLKLQKKGLMQDLLTGKVRVNAEVTIQAEKVLV